MLTLCMLYFSWRIYRTIHRHQEAIKNEQTIRMDKTEHQTSQSLNLIFLFTFISFLPTMAYVLFTKLKIEWREQMWFLVSEKVSMSLLLCNNIVNPIIYGWKDKQLKTYIQQIWSRRRCRKNARITAVNP